MTKAQVPSLFQQRQESSPLRLHHLHVRRQVPILLFEYRSHSYGQSDERDARDICLLA